MVQRFKGQSCCHSAVAYYRYMPTVFFALIFRRDSHAKSSRNRGGRMAYSKRIIDAFAPLWEAADAAVFTVGMKHASAAGKYLVPICLVPHVPYQLVIGSIEYVMQCHAKLHNAEARTKMPAMHTDTIYNELAQLI